MSTSLFVTGASSGIGAAFLARVPAEAGAPHSFSRRPAPGHWHGVDLGDQRQWPTVIAAVEAALDADRPEHAVSFHRSGTGDPVGRAVDLDPADYASVVVLNAASGMALGQAFLRACSSVTSGRRSCSRAPRRQGRTCPGWRITAPARTACSTGRASSRRSSRPSPGTG